MAEKHEPNSYGEPAEQDRHMTVGRYVATRFTTLKPAMEKVPNPFKSLALLNTQQWMFFFVGFIGWTWVSSTTKYKLYSADSHVRTRLISSRYARTLGLLCVGQKLINSGFAHNP